MEAQKREVNAEEYIKSYTKLCFYGQDAARHWSTSR